MSKFKVRLKLTGFELEIEGTKEDVPRIAQSVGQAVAALTDPAALIIDGDARPRLPNFQQSGSDGSEGTKGIRRRARRLKQASASDSGQNEIEFRHDPERWGNPLQTWTTANKSIWLLHIVGSQADVKSMSSAAIAATFNKHFRQAGLIQRGNVGRDLGRQKGQIPSPVGEDAISQPPKWFLTTEGERIAKELVKESLGQNVTAQ